MNAEQLFQYLCRFSSQERSEMKVFAKVSDHYIRDKVTYELAEDAYTNDKKSRLTIDCTEQ